MRLLLLTIFYWFSMTAFAEGPKKVDTRKFVYQQTAAYTLYMEADLPEGSGPFPYLIYVHGGGWQNGDPDVFKKQSLWLASRGIAGIRISYPLIPEGGTFLLAMEAIDEAVRFIRKKAPELKLDNARFGFCGASAGAHLAALAAMRTGGCNLCIGMAGTYDLLHTKAGDFPAEELRTSYLGSADTTVIRSASAMYQIPPRNIPACLLMHGTDDQVIDLRQSKAFAATLREKGGIAEEVYYPGVDHGVNSRTDTALFHTTVKDMYAFCSRIFARKRVACVGNSITYGVLVDKPTDAYPYMLQEKLGPDYEVRNFGVPGASVQLTKDKTYLKTKQYEELIAYQPDILVLKLGTNDSHPNEWSTEAFFYADYVRLIRALKRTGASVFLCLPTPPFGEKWKERDRILTRHIIPLIRQVAEEEQLSVIDLYESYEPDSSLYFPDGIHPTRKGYEIISNRIFEALQQHNMK